MLGHGSVGELALGQIPVVVTEFILADAGAFVFGAQDVAVRKTIPLSIEPASFASAGHDTALEKGFATDAETAPFLLDGKAVWFPRSEAASFLWTGQDVGAKRTRIFSPILPASFALVGNNVSILVRELVTEIITESGTWVKDPLYDKSQPIKIECWGCGGNGATAAGFDPRNGGKGGGGGAYSCTNALFLGDGTLTLNIPAGGSQSDTWASTTGSSPTSTSEGCMADGALNGTGRTGNGTGGTVANSIGDVRFAGGNGGAGGQNQFSATGAGGGGGAAGPDGAGANGASAGANSGGAGGGGSNGGSGGSGPSGGVAGDGGNGGGGGGDGGDGGGTITTGSGRNGDNGDSADRSGGGGGGGAGTQGSFNGSGGNGGAYGGGGGGGGNGDTLWGGGTGGNGLIRITYSRVAVVASVSAAAAAYLLSGQSVGIRATRFQFPDPAAFTLTGQDIIHRLGYYVVGDPAAFTLTGNDVWVRRTRLFHVDRADYDLAGQDVDWLWHRVQRPLPARFLLEAGGSIYLGTEKHILATPASYVLTAYPVQFGRRLARQGVLVSDPQAFDALFQSLSLTGQIVSDPLSVEQLFKPGW